jgi:hypothetical protein
MESLHIITRCTRTTKLKEIFDSLKFDSKKISMIWYVLFDLNSINEISSDTLTFLSDKAVLRFYNSEPNDYGHDLINKTIDEISDGLIYVLDDDNILHSNFKTLIEDWVDNHFSYDGLIFNQKIGGIDFTGLDEREASLENCKVGHIDMAQFCLKRKLIGDVRIPKNLYVGDGMFIERLVKENPQGFRFVKEIGCYYNYFKQIEIKDYFLPKVLVIGEGEQSPLNSYKYASYEDDRLKTKHSNSDKNVNEILSSFNPDSIVSVGSEWQNFKELASLPVEMRRKWLM